MLHTKRQYSRYRLRNGTKFFLFILTLLLCFVAIYMLSGGFRRLTETLLPTEVPTLNPPAPTSTPEPTPTPTPAYSDVIVVVDPGHGGRDPGAVSPYDKDFYEKEITLDIGLKLKEKLEQEGIQVVMTRDTDIELNSYWKEDVWARPRIANEVKATFFVSIHVNSIKGETYNGTEIYHYGKNHGEFTSEQFAGIMGEEIDKVTDTKYNGVYKKDLGVLRLSEMPALLVETAYITNKADHNRLKSNEFREDMAEGIYQGTLKVLETMGSK